MTLLTTSLTANSVPPSPPFSLVQSGDTSAEFFSTGFAGNQPSGVSIGPQGSLTVFTPGHIDLLVSFDEFLFVTGYTGLMPETATVAFECKIDGNDCTGGPMEVLKASFKTSSDEGNIGLRTGAKWLIQDVTAGPHIVQIFIRINSQGTLGLEGNHEVFTVTPYREVQ